MNVKSVGIEMALWSTPGKQTESQAHCSMVQTRRKLCSPSHPHQPHTAGNKLGEQLFRILKHPHQSQMKGDKLTSHKSIVREREKERQEKHSNTQAAPATNAAAHARRPTKKETTKQQNPGPAPTSATQ